MRKDQRTNRTSITVTAALLCSALCIGTALGNSGTPQTNRTGAPGHTTCTACHGSAIGNGSVTLDFSGGSQYQVGQLYSMTITVSDPGQQRFGFSMVARDVDNNLVNVGTWSIAPGSTDTQVHGPGNANVSHKNTPLTPGISSRTFEVNWTAPATGVGDVRFYVSANAANGNFSSTGDFIYVSTLTITESVVMNQPPSFSVPEDPLNVTRGLSSPIAGISLDDIDAGPGNVTVIASVQNGVLRVSDSVPGGVTAGDITDNGTASLTIDGTIAQLNATFGDPNGLTYRSDAGFLGNETLELKANDNGNTGPGGSQTGEATLAISVNPPPSLDDLHFLGDGSFQFTLTGVPATIYTVEYSDDLETWEFLEEVTLVTDVATITDSGAPDAPTRFYRASEGTAPGP